MKNAVLISFAAVGAVMASPAYAADGFAACMAMSKQVGRSFFAEPVAADQSKTDALGMQFGQFLRENGHTVDVYTPKDAPPAELTVDCRWHATKEGAAAWRDQVMPGLEARGFRAMRLVFKPR